jgi:hypothetical protein
MLPSQELGLMQTDDLGGELVELLPPARPGVRRDARGLVGGDEVENTAPWGGDGPPPAPARAPAAVAFMPSRAAATAPMFPGPLAGPLPSAPIEPQPPLQPRPDSQPVLPSRPDSQPALQPISGPAPAAQEQPLRSWKVVTLFAGLASLLCGIILGVVLLAVGVFDGRGPGAPETPGEAGVALAQVEIEGGLPESAIAEVFEHARPHLEMCRQPESTRVSLEAIVTANGSGPERISAVRPRQTSSPPDPVASCCVSAFLNGVPATWSPSGSGTATFEIVLPAR